MPGGQPGMPVGANPQQATGFGASAFGQTPQGQVGSQAGSQPGSQPGQPNATQSGTNGAQPAAAAQASTATTADAAAANATPSGLLHSDPPLLDGKIIGVRSNITTRS